MSGGDKVKNESKARKVINEYKRAGKKTDPDGWYTGNCKGKKEKPVQDADDL